MTLYSRLTQTFSTKWSTLLVGWEGLGRYSPWHSSANDFPSLLTACDVMHFAEERLKVSGESTEIDMIVELMSLSRNASREEVRAILARLAVAEKTQEDIELRKWRLISLEELFNTLSNDPINALISLTEFWQTWGFPNDSPHDIHDGDGRDRVINYFTDETLDRVRRKHVEWILNERSFLLTK